MTVSTSFLSVPGPPSLCLLGGTAYASQVPATRESQPLVCPLTLPFS